MHIVKRNDRLYALGEIIRDSSLIGDQSVNRAPDAHQVQVPVESLKIKLWCC